MNGSSSGHLLKHSLTYFERKDKAIAAKATYDVLLTEKRKEYPDINLQKSAFKRHVGLIENW